MKIFNKKIKFLIFTIVCLTPILLGNELQNSVATYQKALVNSGITGSSVAGVFSEDKTLAFSIVNSSIEGDKSISDFQSLHLNI